MPMSLLAVAGRPIFISASQTVSQRTCHEASFDRASELPEEKEKTRNARENCSSTNYLRDVCWIWTEEKTKARLKCRFAPFFARDNRGLMYWFAKWSIYELPPRKCRSWAGLKWDCWQQYRTCQHLFVGSANESCQRVHAAWYHRPYLICVADLDLALVLTAVTANFNKHW